MTFVKNRGRHDGTITYHLVEGRSPRCVSRVEEPATEEEFCYHNPVTGGMLRWQSRYPPEVVLVDGRPHQRWTCTMCWRRYARAIIAGHRF